MLLTNGDDEEKETDSEEENYGSEEENYGSENRIKTTLKIKLSGIINQDVPDI